MVATQMGITDWRLSQVHNETTGRANTLEVKNFDLLVKCPLPVHILQRLLSLD